MKPNLFKYATKELSQDAFICWLVAWASPEKVEFDNSLHQCGQMFLRSMLGNEWENKPIHLVKVRRQELGRIDILIEVNAGLSDATVLLIEDKTDTSSHGSQLERYREAIRNHPEYSAFRLLCIYVKTGDQSHFEHEISQQYKVYNRQDFLNILEHALALTKTSNPIIQDFFEYLQEKQKHFMAWQSTPFQEWQDSAAAWRGFYAAIQERLQDGEYAYVSNPQGGFEAFWFGVCQHPMGGDVYFQFEQTANLYLRISGDKSSCQQRADDIFRRLTEGKISQVRFDAVRRKSGASMRLAQIANAIKVHPDGLVDLDKTLGLLSHASQLLAQAIKTER